MSALMSHEASTSGLPQSLASMTDLSVPHWKEDDALEYAYVDMGDRRVWLRDLDQDARVWVSRWFKNARDSAIEHEKGRSSETSWMVRHHDLDFRASLINSISFSQLSARAITKDLPKLSDLNAPPYWHELMMMPEFSKGGLVIITAPCGEGKTTHLNSWLKARSTKMGSYIVTAEDPPEYCFDSVEGPGIILQKQVSDATGGYAQAMKDAVRQFPSCKEKVICLGEVRDAETAAEMLTACNNGMLVVCTMHALSVRAALERLTSLARSQMSGEYVRDNLAAGFRLLITQRLVYQKGADNRWSRGKYIGQLLYSTGETSNIASTIKKGRFELLREPLKRQRAIMETSAKMRRPFPEVLQKMRESQGRPDDDI